MNIHDFFFTSFRLAFGFYTYLHKTANCLNIKHLLCFRLQLLTKSPLLVPYIIIIFAYTLLI